MPSNTPETQALLPVTPDFSRETLRTNIESILRNSRDVHTHSLTRMIMDVIPRAAPHSDSDVVDALQALFDDYKELADSGDAGFWSLEDTPVGKQALAALENARHRQSSSNAGGVDVEALRPLREITALSADPDSKRILCLHFRREIGSEHREAILAAVNVAPRDDDAALASLSTPTAEPMAELQRLGQEYDRDDAAEATLLRAVCDAQEVAPYRGWNLTALNKVADQIREHLGLPPIRDLNPDIAAMQDAAEANKDAIRALTTPPTPDRIGKDAVREAAEEARNVLAWIFETSDDHQSAMKAETAWRKLDAALSATPAQPVDETERCQKGSGFNEK